MNDQLNNFIRDLVIILQEKYNDTVHQSEQEKESIVENAYRLGSNTAFYDVLSLIETQFKVFGYNADAIGEITPALGQKAKL